MNLLDKILLARLVRPAPFNSAKPVWVGAVMSPTIERAPSGGGGGGGGGADMLNQIYQADATTDLSILSSYATAVSKDVTLTGTRLLVFGLCVAQNTGAAAQGQKLRVAVTGATAQQIGSYQSADANDIFSAEGFALFTGLSGTVTVTLQVAATNGSGSALASNAATTPEIYIRRIVIFDLD